MNAQVQRVREGVLDLMASDRWEEWLKVQARFHRYSFYNTMLILMQRPDATRVAGYRTWQKLGRQVQRGERGISILAPVPWRKETDDGEEVGGLWFKTVHVFDVSQTEGDPLPEIAAPLQSGDHAATYERLVALAEAQGYAVRESDRIRANGQTDVRGAIALKADLAPDQKVKTLLHELAHQKLDHLNGDDRPREIQELEAESVAYICCEQLGLDTSGYSFGYLASWSEDPRALSAALTECGTRIADCAKVILEQLNWPEEG